MQIPTTAAKPPKPPPFMARAEAFLAAKLESWKHDLIGSPAEEAALQYARREGWVLPNEGLNAVTALNLLPNCTITDLARYNCLIKDGSMTEAEATRCIAANARNDMGEAEAGIQRLRFPDLAAGAVAPAALPPPSNPTPPAKAAPAACQGVLRGVPEGMGSCMKRLHFVVFGGVEVYTFDHKIMNDLQGAQVNGLHLAVETVAGDHGWRILSLKVADRPSLS